VVRSEAQRELNLDSRGLDLLLSDSYQETVPALAGCLLAFRTPPASPPRRPHVWRSSQASPDPLTGFLNLSAALAGSWLRGLVSYRLRPWDTLVFEVPPSRGSVPLSGPIRPCRSTRPDRSAGPPRIFARAFREGPKRHPGVAARTSTRGFRPRPELDRARGSEGSPLPRPTRPTSINPRCRPYEPNSRLRRLPPLENPTPSGKPEGRDSFDLALSEASPCWPQVQNTCEPGNGLLRPRNTRCDPRAPKLPGAPGAPPPRHRMPRHERPKTTRGTELPRREAAPKLGTRPTEQAHPNEACEHAPRGRARGNTPDASQRPWHGRPPFRGGPTTRRLSATPFLSCPSGFRPDRSGRKPGLQSLKEPAEWVDPKDNLLL